MKRLRKRLSTMLFLGCTLFGLAGCQQQSDTASYCASVESTVATLEKDTAIVETDAFVATTVPEEQPTLSEIIELPESIVSDGSIELAAPLIVIDAGHQAKGNSEKEPIGPGATEQKAKVSGGTTGCVTGLREYELNLLVAEKLQSELEHRGYEVIMVRTSHDVDISNSERAAVANEAEADAFIRIHANGSDDSSVHGAMTLCQTATNPYNSELYEQSKKLSEEVLDGMVATTGCKKRSIWETDTMSGINWCQVPVTIVEMGFMTNPNEDTLMATDDYQTKIAMGIADGIDAFFAEYSSDN